MTWKHQKDWFRGPITAKFHGGQVIAGTGFYGVIETGKSRMFHGYYSRVQLENGIDMAQEHPRHLLSSLSELSAKIGALGVQLMCTGLAEEFYESGLSCNTGWGYLQGASEPIHIMDIHHCDRVHLAKV